MKVLNIVLGLLLTTASVTIAHENKSTGPVDMEHAAEYKYCPICGPSEEMEHLPVTYKYEGKKYGFCSIECMKAFKKDPAKYLNVEKKG